MGNDPEAGLVQRLAALCLEHGISIATAESCTGGLVAKLITDQAGSSSFFRGGVVSYANEAKTALLGVPPELLESHGAVSAQAARVMAAGVRARLDADMGVSVTGVSGPGGGSAAKPIGLTYVAVADVAGEEVRRFVWSGDRDSNRHSSASAALQMLIDRLEAAASRAADAEAATAGYGASS
jgi:nicotinamide-nucleotide amidase